MKAGMLLTMTIAVSSLAACNTVPINTNDQTVPAVEIKIKSEDGQYSAVSDAFVANLANPDSRLDIMCIVTDPDGVQSASLVFAHTVAACRTYYTSTGTFPYDPVPPDVVLPATAKNGKVLDKLAVLATVKGPFTCNQPPSPGFSGFIAAPIKAVCRGENWSSSGAKQSSEKTLWINSPPGILPPWQLP